jgi:hypothetical protein
MINTRNTHDSTKSIGDKEPKSKARRESIKEMKNKMKRRYGICSSSIHETPRNNPSNETEVLRRNASRRGGVVFTSSPILPINTFNGKRLIMNENNNWKDGGIDMLRLKESTFGNKKEQKNKLCAHFHPEDEVKTPSEMDIIIDVEKSFDVDYGCNVTFLAILRTYYADRYLEATSKTHKTILLNIILDEVYHRGFKFLWKSPKLEQYFAMKDEVIILKHIRLALKKM